MEGIVQKGDEEQQFGPLDQVYSRYINDLQLDGVVCYAVVSKEQLEFMLYQNMIEFESSFSVKHTLAEECLIYSNHDQHVATQNLCRVNNTISDVPSKEVQLISTTLLVCSICRDEIVDGTDVQRFVPCQHQVHSSCCRQLTQHCLQEMWSTSCAVSIECPDCKAQKKLGFLTECQVGDLLGWESDEFVKFQKNRLQVLPKDMMYCPNPECERMIALLKCQKSKGRSLYSAECECSKRFCTRCTDEEHWPLTCSEWLLFKRMEDNLIQDDMLEAQMQLMYGMNTRLEARLEPVLLDFLDTRLRNQAQTPPHLQLLNRYFQLLNEHVPENLMQLVNPRQVRDIGAIRELFIMERMQRVGVVGRGGAAREANILRRMAMEDEEDLFVRGGAAREANILRRMAMEDEEDLFMGPFNRLQNQQQQDYNRISLQLSNQENNSNIQEITSSTVHPIPTISPAWDMDVVAAAPASSLQIDSAPQVAQSSHKLFSKPPSFQHHMSTPRDRYDAIFRDHRHSIRSRSVARSKLQNRVKTNRMSWASMFNFGSSKFEHKSGNTSDVLLDQDQDQLNLPDQTFGVVSTPLVVSDPQCEDFVYQSSKLGISSQQDSQQHPLSSNPGRLFPDFQSLSSLNDSDDIEQLFINSQAGKNNKGGVFFQEITGFDEIISSKSNGDGLQYVSSKEQTGDNTKSQHQAQGSSQDIIFQHNDSSLSEDEAATAAAASTSSSGANLVDDKGDATGEGGAEESIAQICKDCPNCFVPVYLFSGCNHVVCGKCSHEFCYQCRKPWQAHGYSSCLGESKDLPSKNQLEHQWQQFAKQYHVNNSHVKKEEWFEERLRREREMREKFTDSRQRYLGNLLEMREPEENIQERRERREQQLQFLNQLSQQVQLRKMFVMQTALFQQIQPPHQLQLHQIQSEYQRIWQSQQLYKTMYNYSIVNSCGMTNQMAEYCFLVRDCCRVLFNFRILLFLMKTGVTSLSRHENLLDETRQRHDQTFQLAMFQIEALEQHTQKGVAEIQHSRPADDLCSKIPVRRYTLNRYLRNFVERIIEWDLLETENFCVSSKEDRSGDFEQQESLQCAELNNSRRFKALLREVKRWKEEEEMNCPISGDTCSDDGLLCDQI